jgi:cyclopropane-fatty-acyl-phospholipid synthase
MSSPDGAAGAIRGERGHFLEPLVRRFFAHIETGDLTVDLPSGARLAHKGARPGPQACLTIHRWRAIWRLILVGDVGFAESYIAGDWTSPNLPALIELAARNIEPLEAKISGSFATRLIARLRHLARANTRTGSRKNISFHYDLGNSFYQCWLDPSMSYSSALYAGAFDTLEDAQARKIARIAELLDIKGDTDVLEIGCGWGALAIALAERCRSVKGVTLSAEQLAYARGRVRDARLDNKVTLELSDYRDIAGSFDRIVSIEMIEAVGEAFWPTYFQTLHDRLRPGGTALLQAITIDEGRFDSYRQSPDFIQRHVFPGGMLPTRSAIVREAEKVGLSFSFSERFSESYARTLAEWRRRFLASRKQVDAMGFSEQFQRMWDYYLSYSEGGFRAGVVDVGFYKFQRVAAQAGAAIDAKS